MAVFCLTTLPRVILSSIIMARLSSNNVIRNNGIRENTRRSYTTIFTLIENHLHSHGLLISYGRTSVLCKSDGISTRSYGIARTV